MSASEPCIAGTMTATNLFNQPRAHCPGVDLPVLSGCRQDLINNHFRKTWLPVEAACDL
ncbi:hypothetical protein [Sporomusa termitida]|uniref:hypothetical protein n=1 Tax=Sporomusa termitida TaxID=2377 RepID=UPI001478A1C5|nr:hypothetical protein [Sporomusa termitida]